MDLLWSLALVVGIIAALVFMAGGKPASVLRPLGRAVGGLVSAVLGRLASGLGAGVKGGLGASNSAEPLKPKTYLDNDTTDD